LNHENIVKLYEDFLVDGTLYIVMELCGCSMSARARVLSRHHFDNGVVVSDVLELLTQPHRLAPRVLKWGDLINIVVDIFNVCCARVRLLLWRYVYMRGGLLPFVFCFHLVPAPWQPLHVHATLPPLLVAEFCYARLQIAQSVLVVGFRP
jgi:hypothetical protein